ncbi:MULTISPECIES: S49 family peptidase [unclassified Pseudomonas]|uniref:S49 family peptidase n=1 Tax=unclassified Pseudomonas TaxID=196821 RepID=UPI001C608724|nr:MULTISPECIES: S49 family peptidase [unclassified Pseudomonas]MBW5416117.1 S49 family peptidase [Pseudomonas sp. MAG002Y]
MHSAFELATAQPWLMLPNALENLLAIAERKLDPDALETRLGKSLDNTRTVTMRDGVAIIPVTGPIFRYANLFTRISGATSTQVLATDIQTALDDPKVKSIVLNIDSPGGEANGINELADLVYAARAQKKIVAYVGGTGASAAYWIASAASEIVVDATAVLGSIGVVLEVVTRKAAEGEKRYVITSSNAPNKRPDIETEEGRALVGKTIDALGEVFTARVARNLGVKKEDVPAMGDHGGLLIGAQAVESGLAHRVDSLESVIRKLAVSAPTQPRKLIVTTVKTTAELQAALAAGTDPQTITIAAERVDVEAIKANAHLEGRKEGLEAGAAAERERIAGIQALAQPGFDAEIKTAITEGLSVEAAGLALYKAAQDRGVTLAGIKNDATRAGAAAPKGERSEKRTINTQSIWAGRKGVKA